MEEIVEQIYFEIKNSGFEKKLIAGIVLTGGGAQLKHIDQLTEFTTGMATRVGYPNEHLANDVVDEMASPMYATGIGLVIEGISRFDYEKNKEEIALQNEEGKDTSKQKRKKKLPKKDNNNSGESSGSRFLNYLKDWFDNDTSE